jgi:adenylate cyclase
MTTAQAPKSDSRRPNWRGWLLGIALTVAAGKILLLPLGDGLARMSYDLPFTFQDGVPSELVMVYLDGNAKRNLDQPPDQPLDRYFYTDLLNRLKDDGAKLVLFDIIYDLPHPDPAVDDAFADAIDSHGKVVLVADYIKELNGNVFTEAPLPSIALLNTMAAGWGLAKVSPDAGDWAIRKLDAGVEDYPSASWAAATVLKMPLDEETRMDSRFLNYYCWPGNFHAVSIDQALATNGLPKGTFQDKVVVVGSRPTLGIAGAAREEFPNPWAWQGRGHSTGPAVHGLSLLNLMRGDWLTRLSGPGEFCVILLWGVFITVLLMKLRPWMAVGAALVCSALLAIVAGYIQLKHCVWFAWVIPAAGQTSIALVWAVGYQYLVENQRRRQLHNAFGAYLSPYMADRISDQEFDLSLGGREVEATVMFTDLEGFTKMSESLPPSEVSKILTTYFNQTTRVILEQEGTIIKYIGDAVLAVWGAPIEDPKHAERAVLAAWGMSEACKEEVEGRTLRTRLGVNTGIVLAGNLGSDFRFDYTVIGATTNLAARLEGLNKYLGTDILISESTQAQISDAIQTRCLGRFLVVGKSKASGIFEVLGPSSNFQPPPSWLEIFSRGREHFNQRELDDAEKCFREVIELREGSDGPSQLYLAQIETARLSGPEDSAWDGALRFTEK